MSELSTYNQPDYKHIPSPFPHECATAWGEDQYGIWFELTLNKVVQRFRWIPKGEFSMGSPEAEKERFDDENLHQVTLTQGFWLADTACTQALWEAVMSENLSHFTTDKQLPVDSVSWEGVQRFIVKLNQRVPGLDAHLPTEAQWEYACRAGTTSPFSFGENITPQQVNYDGSRPYAGAEEGEYRKETLPVKALAANSWGLYQMHGNVWEWCFDEWRPNLGNAPVTNPVTAQYKSAEQSSSETGGNETVTSLNYDSASLANEDDGNVERVLRGGSWGFFGGFCRSAIRLEDQASNRDRSGVIGFRFAVGLELRSR